MSTQITQYVVALVGATGDLGKDVTNVFLTHYHPFFRTIAVVRDSSSAGARLLAEQGAELRQLDATDLVSSFAKAFEGVDVVVNVVGDIPVEYHDALFEGALKSGVKVYFPSEFGADVRFHDFPGWNDLVWQAKAQHLRKARELAGGKVKIIAVSIGLFVEALLTPWFGFDTTNLTYTSVGSPDQRLAVTSKADIGRAVAELSLLALSPDSAPRVPDHVRITGNSISFKEVWDIVRRVRAELGVEPRNEIVLKSEDLESFKAITREKQLKNPPPFSLAHIRIVMGEGKMDFSENDNELVNPGQQKWKWESIEEYIRESGGQLGLSR